MKNQISIFFMLMLYSNIIAQEFEILQHDKSVKIIALSQLNSTERECNLSILPNGKSIYFMSKRERNKGEFDGTGDIYRSDYVNGAWQDPVELGASINTYSGEDEPSFSQDGSVMYYQSWEGDWKSLGGPYYTARNENGTWKKTGSMGASINKFFTEKSEKGFGYATDGMAVSANGKIFIVACGENYDGAMDLYYSLKTETGWTYPKIMGISTEGDERSVFIAGDNRTIYYSSDGMGGFGGLDIFKVSIEKDGKLGKPINIGAPFNTNADDMGFVASADGGSAFFIRNLDIYFADITALSEKLKPDKKEELENNMSNKKNETTIIKKEKTIYFRHNEFYIDPLEMAKLLEINNTISNIEIHGYCDIDGNSDYNLKLSERRCHSVMEELSKNGLVKSEIKKYAHGESVQINSNPSLDRKAANRRVLITYKE
jgi:outer membrane protein OmpA-like peptidoglycan-associated protein